MDLYEVAIRFSNRNGAELREIVRNCAEMRGIVLEYITVHLIFQSLNVRCFKEFKKVRFFGVRFIK